MAEQNRPNTNVTDFERVRNFNMSFHIKLFFKNALQHIVHTIQQYRILLVSLILLWNTLRSEHVGLQAGRIHGLEEYQALLDYVEDIAEEVIRLGELPASEAARQLVDIFFGELFDMMQIIMELLN